MAQRHGGGPARVLLADPHEQFRAALRAYLETLPGIQVVAEVSTGPDAVSAAEDARPDIALVDLGLCADTGLVALLKDLDGHARVVISSIADDPAYAQRALRLGADAWVAKDDLAGIQALLTDHSAR